jgi:hypothetical protein
MKKTKIEIIDETVKYYSTHKRGIGTSGCTYLNNEGDMCAVGRCITKKEIGNLAGIGDVSMLDQVYDSKIPFKASYKGHDSGFWQLLQNFHDRDEYWTPNKRNGSDLTSTGICRLEILKQRYANN